MSVEMLRAHGCTVEKRKVDWVPVYVVRKGSALLWTTDALIDNETEWVIRFMGEGGAE